MSEINDRAHNLYLGVALVLAGVTPAWLFTAYQTAEVADRRDFWQLERWPAFIPTVIGLALLVALLAEAPLPGLLGHPRVPLALPEGGEPPKVPAALLAAVQPNVVARGHKRMLGDRKFWGAGVRNEGTRPATAVDVTVHLLDGTTRTDRTARLEGSRDDVGRERKPDDFMIEVGPLPSDAQTWFDNLRGLTARFSDADGLGRWERRFDWSHDIGNWTLAHDIPAQADLPASPLPTVHLHVDPMNQHVAWVDGERSDHGFWLHEPYVEAIGRVSVTNAGAERLRLHHHINVLDLVVRAPDAASVSPYHSFPDLPAGWTDFEMTGYVEPGATEQFNVSFAVDAVRHEVPIEEGRTSEGWSMPDGPVVTRIEMVDQWNRRHVSPPITFRQ